MDKNDKHNISGAQFPQPHEEFAVRSATSGVCFDYDEVSPLIGRYVGVDDALQIVSFANAGANTITINIRMLDLNGRIIPQKFTQNTQGGGAANSSQFQLMEGWIISATVDCNAQPNSQFYCFVQLGLTRAPFGVSNVYDVLCAGYVGQQTCLSYPESPIQRPTDGMGVVNVQTQAAPAAGTDLTFVVPANTRMRIISVLATLTTSAVAGNRVVALIVDNAATALFSGTPNTTQIASLSVTYSFADSVQNTAIANGVVNSPLPSQLILPAGFRVRTLTTGILAGDQWSAMSLLVQEWADAT